MKACVEFVSQQDRTVGECLNNWANEAEPDKSAERLVPCIELDLGPRAAVNEAHSELVERRSVICAIGVAFLPNEDADSALQTFLHDRVELVHLRPRDAQVCGSQ